MADPNLVSIVVVSYNNWPIVELTVQSALCQSYVPVEIIVVDNGSIDGSVGELRERFKERITLIQQANTGDAGAYNTGFKYARGEFIQFIDGDDVLTPYKIEKQMEVMRTRPETDIVYGDTRLFQERAGEAEFNDTDTGPEEDLLRTVLESCANYFGNTLGTLFRRKVFEQIGFWDEKVYLTDADFYIRALWAGCRFRYCSDALMGLVSRGPGRMAGDSFKMSLGHEALWTKALGYITAEPYRTLVRTNLARIQFVRAVTQSGMSKRESLAKLAQSRKTKHDEVGLAASVLAFLVIVIPMGHRIATRPQFRFIRRLIARIVRVRLPGRVNGLREKARADGGLGLQKTAGSESS
jgi:glycosyltransferase involved in cell wall biosynthesis